MDEADAFFQQLEIENLLKQHGPALVADARRVLAKAPDAKVAGLITTADSPDATAMRTMIANATGLPVAAGLLVCIVPRQLVDALAHHPDARPPVARRVLAGTGDFASRGLDARWASVRVLPDPRGCRGRRVGRHGLVSAVMTLIVGGSHFL